MTSPRGNSGQLWFRLPYNWDMDETLVGLPEGTKLLFIKIVEFCHAIGSDGSLTEAQLQFISRGYARGKQGVDRLKAAGALREDSVETGSRQSQYSVETPATQLVYIANAARWLPGNNTPKSITPAQNRNRAPKKEETAPRAPARVKRDREIDREEERTPSGSVRSSSAQAAPRVASGAAQPAPKDLEAPDSAPGNGGGTMSRAEAIAFARSEVARGRKKNPAATGIDTKFSKYDPNRPIEPITSNFLFGEDPE